MYWNSPYVRSCFHEDVTCYGDDVYSVYFWQDDDTNEVFYVGSGKFYRFNDVNPKSRSPEFTEYYSKHKCSPKIVAYGMTQEQARNFEKRLIDAYWKLKFPLVNKQGVAPRGTEYRRRAEIKKRITV